MNDTQDHRIAKLLRLILGLWVVWLVLALSTWTYNPASPIKDLGTGWVACVLAIVACAGVVSGKLPTRFGTPTQLVVALFLFVHFFAALVSEHQALSLFHLRTWTSYVVIMVVAAQVLRRPNDVWIMVKVAIGAIAVSSVYGFLQHFHLDPFPWSATNREEYRGLPATYGHPNMAGHVLVLGLLMGLGLIGRMLSIRAWGRALAWAVPTAAIATHLYLTGMRSAILALVAACILLGVFWIVRKITTRPTRAVGITVGLVAVGGVLATTTALFLVLPAAGDDEPISIDGSLVLRANGYYGAAEMILDRPLLGHGPGTYALENIAKWTDFEQAWFASENLRNLHAHNDLLEAGVEAGLIGMASYLLVLVWALLHALAMGTGVFGEEKRRIGLLLAACFAAFAVGGAFDFNLRVPVSGGLFFLLLGALDGLSMPSLEIRKSAKMSSAAFAVAGTLCALLMTWSFIGEMALHRVAGWRLLAAQRLVVGDTAEVRYAREEAVRTLSVGRARMPWDRRFHEGLGRLAFEQGRFVEAASSYEAAMDCDPHHPTLLVDAARAHLESARHQGAENELNAAVMLARKALSYVPMLPSAHEVLGRAEFLRATMRDDEVSAEQWENVAEHFSNALRHGVNGAAAIKQMLAQVYALSGDARAAARYFDDAVGMEPGNERGWQVYHRFAVEQGQEESYRESVRQQLNSVRYAGPVDPSTLGALALRTLEAHPYDDGLRMRFLLDVLPLGPPQLQVWGEYASLLPPEERLSRVQTMIAQASTWEERSLSTEVLDALVTLSPVTLEKLRAVSESLVRLARLRVIEADAEAVSAEAAWVAPVLLAAGVAVADSSTMQGEFLTNVGETLVISEAWSEAEGPLLEAIDLLEGTALGWANYQYAQVLAATERHAEAVEPAKVAARMFPTSSAVQWNLAKRLVDVGRLNQAKFQYQKLFGAFMGSEAERAALEAEYAALSARIEEAP